MLQGSILLTQVLADECQSVISGHVEQCDIDHAGRCLVWLTGTTIREGRSLMWSFDVSVFLKAAVNSVR